MNLEDVLSFVREVRSLGAYGVTVAEDAVSVTFMPETKLRKLRDDDEPEESFGTEDEAERLNRIRFAHTGMKPVDLRHELSKKDNSNG